MSKFFMYYYDKNNEYKNIINNVVTILFEDIYSKNSNPLSLILTSNNNQVSNISMQKQKQKIVKLINFIYYN